MSTKSFPLQEKMSTLEAIESYFNQPDMDLEAAIAKHQDALKVAQEILAYLAEAESTIEALEIADTLS